jgi:hypothetical protein
LPQRYSRLSSSGVLVTAFATFSAILWYTSNRFSRQASASVYAADGRYGQIGGCREVFRRNKGPYGEGPRLRQRSDGAIEVVWGREHLDGFAKFTVDIVKWLGEMGQ